MDYVILSDNEPIGIMSNPGADPPMGMVQGPFVPLPAYETVRPLFRRFVQAKRPLIEKDDVQALERFYQERETLKLAVTTRDGLPIPVAWVHVYDYGEELGNDGYEGEFNVPSNPLFEPSGIFFEDKRYWDGSPYWLEEDDKPHTGSE